MRFRRKWNIVNRKRKDTLFCLIFGRQQNRQWTLSLYNAVNGSDYQDPDVIEFNTLEEALFMGVKNDVSFILDSVMSLYEHQSTFNPNMPLRQLEYTASLYKKYLAENNLDKYSSAPITIPFPKLLVFYNGTTDEPEKTVLKLSELFPERFKGMEADVSVNTTMLNINYGHNRELLEKCRPLYEYAWTIETERRYSKQMSVRKAITKTLEDMPDSFVIKRFLVSNKAAYTDSFLTDYDEDLHIKNEKKISYDKGHAEGHAKGFSEGKALMEKENNALKKTVADKEAELVSKDSLIAAYEAKYGKL